ncbi:MAG: signal peptidase I, partial [SAR202 cluster bacterium]|nr:signal peptidase I [SAR202 cluster bacterium]
MRAGRHINALLKLPVLGVLLRLLSSGMYVVRGGSMSPALRPGDGVLASGAGYLGSPPARGDIVVIRETPVGGRRTIKRVVGLPSERVRFAEGVLYVD